MSSALLSRSLRVLAIASTCWVGCAASLHADPIVVTSGLFKTSVGEATFYQLFGDGFVLAAGSPLLPTWPSLVCPTLSGCPDGTVVNMSSVAGGESAETPFTLGRVSGAIVNGTEFVKPLGTPAHGPRLAGTFRFDAPVVALDDTTPTRVPFVFSGLVGGFAEDDLDLRRPLFQVALTGRGTASLHFEDFDNNALLSGSSVLYTFDAAPAATPEPASLVLLGTGVAGLVLRARRKRRAATSM